jgi:glucose-6-phosphate 1-dehydrogenase
MAEEFGVEGREKFYDATGAIRDVVQNHLFQVVGLLAMEAPIARRAAAARRDEKVKVFQAIRPLTAEDAVRGQFAGYREKPGVATGSDTETFAALKLFIDSWRWEGVPWYVRAGKRMPVTSTEVVVQLKPGPEALFSDRDPALATPSHLRFRLEPDPAISLTARVKRPGDLFVGDQRELRLTHGDLETEAPYEKLLGDALTGNPALFANEQGVEAAWAALGEVLVNHDPVIPYQPGSWGPAEADQLVPGGWDQISVEIAPQPKPEATAADR